VAFGSIAGNALVSEEAAKTVIGLAAGPAAGLTSTMKIAETAATSVRVRPEAPMPRCYLQVDG
jgi:hypothetical protein